MNELKIGFWHKEDLETFPSEEVNVRCPEFSFHTSSVHEMTAREIVFVLRGEGGEDPRLRYQDIEQLHYIAQKYKPEPTVYDSGGHEVPAVSRVDPLADKSWDYSRNCWEMNGYKIKA